MAMEIVDFPMKLMINMVDFSIVILMLIYDKKYQKIVIFHTHDGSMYGIYANIKGVY